jgi:hypothetical protein
VYLAAGVGKGERQLLVDRLGSDPAALYGELRAGLGVGNGDGASAGQARSLGSARAAHQRKAQRGAGAFEQVVALSHWCVTSAECQCLRRATTRTMIIIMIMIIMMIQPGAPPEDAATRLSVPVMANLCFAHCGTALPRALLPAPMPP